MKTKKLPVYIDSFCGPVRTNVEPVFSRFEIAFIIERVDLSGFDC